MSVPPNSPYPLHLPAGCELYFEPVFLSQTSPAPADRCSAGPLLLINLICWCSLSSRAVNGGSAVMVGTLELFFSTVWLLKPLIVFAERRRGVVVSHWPLGVHATQGLIVPTTGAGLPRSVWPIKHCSGKGTLPPIVCGSRPGILHAHMQTPVHLHMFPFRLC